jgi:hypothetical protein
MLLCNYSGKGIYLCGNVYNGKTWSNGNKDENGKQLYEFNVFSFNNQPLPPIKTIDSDTKFELNEVTKDGTIITGTGICDSWEDNEAKKYYKYNGRKITVINALDYRADSNFYINGNLKIGTNLEINDTSYVDETSISNDGLILFNFNNEYKLVDGNLHLRKTINSNNATIYILKDNDYKYPIDDYGNPAITNTRLFRSIVDNSISGLSIKTDEFIDISNFNDNDSLYWIALPAKDGNIKRSIADNVLKSVTLSELVNIKELKAFYPLNLDNNVCTNILNTDNTFTTTMNLSCSDNISKVNMNNKEFIITFYDDENGKNKLFEVNVTPNGATSQINYRFKSYERELLGFYGNNNPQILYFDYITKMEKNNTVKISPLSYGIRKMVVRNETPEIA